MKYKSLPLIILFALLVALSLRLEPLLAAPSVSVYKLPTWGSDMDGDTIIANNGNVYIRNGSSWNFQANIFPYSPYYEDIQISGNTIIVTEGEPGLGRIYIYARNGTRWSLQTTLFISLLEYSSYFRALIDDNTIAVYSDTADYRDRVQIYTRSGNNWNLQTTIRPPGSDDGFNGELALSGNVLAIGASRRSCLGDCSEGSIYIYNRNGNSWGGGWRIPPFVSVNGPTTIEPRALSGNTLVAWFDYRDWDTDETYQGYYVLVGSGANWGLQAQFPVESGYYPESDIDGNLLIIDDTVYHRSGSTWSLKHVLVPSDPDEDNSFGYGVALSNGTAMVSSSQGTYLFSPLTSADLAITQLTSADPVLVGENLLYDIRVRNTGPDKATGVEFADTFPASVTIVSARSTKGSCNVIAQTIRCTIGTLEVGTAASISIDVQPTLTGVLSNQARAIANESQLVTNTKSTDVRTLSISNLVFEQQDLPSKVWTVLSNGTVDGNIVRITTSVTNPTSQIKVGVLRFTEETTGNTLDSTAQTFRPGLTTFTYEWNTSGYAWNDHQTAQSQRRIKTTIGFRAIKIESTTNVTVHPKPVILVPGFVSETDPNAWNSFKNLMQQKSPLWQGYVVDGVDTGTLLNPFQPTKSMAENVQELTDLIRTTRNSTDAWQVDVLAYSAGGLMSRWYIQWKMPLEPSLTNKPVISHLLMLGTPNGGSPCADLWVINRQWQPAINELTPQYVTEYFNRTITNRRGVPFSILWSDKYFTCGSALGDAITPKDSAFGISIPDNQFTNSMHFHLNTAGLYDMMHSPQDFATFVVPHLAIGPSGAAQNTLFTPEAAPSAMGINSLSTPPPIVAFNQVIELPAGASTNASFTVPGGSYLNVYFSASQSVGATLYNPVHGVAGSLPANSVGAAQPFRGFTIKTPAIGSWTITFNNQGSQAESVSVAAYLEGDPVKLDTQVTQPASQQAKVIAQFTNETTPVTGATLTSAFIRNNGDVTPLALLDDGIQDDGIANNGVYGGTMTNLAPDIYQVVTRAEAFGYSRTTSTVIEIAEVDLSVTSSASFSPVMVGSPLTYTLSVTNTGASIATGVSLIDTLPSGVSFISALTQSGSCENDNGVVDCAIDSLMAGDTVAVTLLVNVDPNAVGTLINTVDIAGEKADPTLVNNHATTSTTVIQPIASPTIVSPHDEYSIADTILEFSWNSIAGVNEYRLQIDDQSDFIDSLVDVAVTDTSYSSQSLQPGTYYWRIRGKNLNGEGQWTTARSFTVDLLAPNTPILIAPSNQAGVNDTTPTLQWNSVIDAALYQMQLAADDIFATPILDVTMPDLSYTPTTALGEGRYFWRVRSADAAGNWGSWSSTSSFDITILQLPLNASIFYNSTPTFEWFAKSGAIAYRLEVSSDALNFTNPVLAFNTPDQLSFTPSDALEIGVYYWHVLVDSGAGFEVSPIIWEFTISGTVLSAPTLISPANETVFNAPVPLTWHSVSGSTGYEVQVDDNADFSSLVQTGTNETSEFVTDALTEGLYYWRVRALNEVSAPGQWSIVRRFRMDKTPPQKPTLTVPANDSSISNVRPFFNWTAVPDAAQYEIQLGTTNPPATTVGTAVKPGFTLAPQYPSGLYYWRVRSLDALGNPSEWSDVWGVNLTSVPNAAPALNFYPTPTITLTWSRLSWSTEYEIQLDMLPTFSSLALIDNTIPVNSSAFTTSELPEGVYYWRVRGKRADGTWGSWSTVESFVIDLP